MGEGPSAGLWLKECRKRGFRRETGSRKSEPCRLQDEPDRAEKGTAPSDGKATGSNLTRSCTFVKPPNLEAMLVRISRIAYLSGATKSL